MSVQRSPVQKLTASQSYATRDPRLHRTQDSRVPIPENLKKVLFSEATPARRAEKRLVEETQIADEPIMEVIDDSESTDGHNDDQSTSQDDGLFVTVKAATNRRKRVRKEDAEPTAIALRNKFNPLTRVPTQLNHDTAPQGDASTTTKSKMPPAIVLYGVRNMTSLIKKVESIVSDKSFFIKKLSDGSKLQLKSKSDYDNVKKFLEESDAQHHAWPNKNERLVKYIIYGLDKNMDCDYIQEDFIAQGIPCVGARVLGKTRTDAYVITIQKQPGFDLKKLEDIKHVCKHSITINTYKYKDPQRCYRCSRYGHGSRYCMAAPRCYLCAQGHEGKDCPKKDPKKCVNCGGNHAAGSKDCDEYKKAMRRYKSSREDKQVERQGNFIQAPQPTSNIWEDRRQASRSEAAQPVKVTQELSVRRQENIPEQISEPELNHVNYVQNGVRPQGGQSNEAVQNQNQVTADLMQTVATLTKMMQQQMQMMQEFMNKIMQILNSKTNYG